MAKIKRTPTDMIEDRITGQKLSDKLNDISAINVNVEVQNARGTFPVLKDRLDIIDSSLADIAIDIEKQTGTTDDDKIATAINVVLPHQTIRLKLGKTYNFSV